MAIDQAILYDLVKKLVLKQNKSLRWEEDILWLAKIIIFHKTKENYITKGDLSLFDLIPPHKSLRSQPIGKGLPIGNYTSQFFANLYLNELDQFVKRNLKCRYYIRYADDFILLDEDESKLKLWQDDINAFLNNKLRLELNLNKTKIRGVEKGIDFLGFFIKPCYTLVRQKVVNRFKNKMYFNRIKKIKNSNEILSQINSYYGHFKHASSFNLRKNLYLNYLTEFEKFLVPMEDFVSVSWNPDYKTN